MGSETLETVVVLSLYAGTLALGIASAWLLLTQRVGRPAAVVTIVAFGVLVEVVCVLFLLRWWHLVPGLMTALRTGIPFVLADAMILLTLFGRRSLLAGGRTAALTAAFWCALVTLLGYLQLFAGSGY